MGKGILLEVEGRSGVVLTPQGEFKRVPLPRGSFDIGDEITYKESGGMRWGWVAAAAAVLLMLLAPAGYNQWAVAQPAALVMIDINPSIQLTLNGRQQVIGAEGLNEDGRLVLEGLAWQKRPVDEVTRAITARAVAVGKLDPAGETSAVVVAVAPVDEQKELDAEKADAIAARSKVAIQTEVKAQAEAKGQAVKAQVAAVEATADEVKEAREQGLTLPKLIILKEVQRSHPEVTAEALKSQGPGKFVQSLGLNPGEVFGEAEQKHNRHGGKAEPATARPKGKDDPSENPSRSDEKGRGQSVQPDEKNPDGQENGAKGNEKDSRESKGIIHAIMKRLGIGSDDDEKGDEAEQGRGKGSDRGSDKDSEKGSGKGSEKGSGKGSEKGSGKDSEKGSDRDSDRGSEKGSDRGSGKGSDRGSDRDSDRDSDRGSDRGSGKGSDRDSDRGAQQRSDHRPGGQEKGDGKANEGSRGNSKP